MPHRAAALSNHSAAQHLLAPSILATFARPLERVKCTTTSHRRAVLRLRVVFIVFPFYSQRRTNMHTQRTAWSRHIICFAMFGMLVKNAARCFVADLCMSFIIGVLMLTGDVNKSPQRSCRRLYRRHSKWLVIDSEF